MHTFQILLYYAFALQALLKRAQVLTPTPEDHSSLLGVVTKIQSILDNIIISPGKTEVSVS